MDKDTNEILSEASERMERNRREHEEKMRRQQAEHEERMRQHDELMAQMKKDTEEVTARTERMIRSNACKNYQTEIHAVAINVLAALLTKDALRAMRDSEFTPSKIDVGEVVDFSLIVGKRYVDELHRIVVSEKQLAEYKDYVQSMTPPSLQPIITPPLGE
jgi:hypothetical protein